MILRLTGMAALVACLGVAGTHSVQAQRQREYQTANSYQAENPYRTADQYEEEGQFQEEGQYLEAEEVGYNSFDAGGFNNCELGGCNSGTCNSGTCGSNNGGGFGSVLGKGLGSRPGQFFAGVDYLNVRSTFSESTAFITRTGGDPVVPGSSLLVPPITNTFNELEYGYESSYRIYGGYRLCDCGGEVRFAFTRFNSSAAANSGAVTGSVGGQTTFFLSPSGDIVATIPGDSISTTSNVTANIYDLGFAKTIPLGSPASGCGDSCCDSGCGWCPAWDIKWSAGLRFANINWNQRASNTTDFGSSTMDFDGGGARVGLEGTRYLGRKQRFAVFARGNMSILLGEVNIEHVTGVLGTGGGPPTAGETTRFSSTQLIPVFDIEAGGTIYVTNNLTVSAGYLLSAWSDLGMRDTSEVVAGEVGVSFDDANILGFDGLFARAELAF